MCQNKEVEMKCTLVICRVTNLQFIAQSFGSVSMTHPLLGMTKDDVSRELLRLHEYKNIIKKDSTLEDVLDEVAKREHMVRVCGLLVGWRLGMITEHFSAVELPLSYSLDYIIRRNKIPIQNPQDLYFMFAHISAEASAISILSENYSTGFPKLAAIDDGCWGRLLTACLEEHDEFVKLLQSAQDLQYRTSWVKMRSAIDYNVLCNRAISVVRFTDVVSGFLKFVGVPDESNKASVDYLYWLYFEETVVNQRNISNKDDEDDDVELNSQYLHSPDDWYNDVRGNVSAMFLENLYCEAPKALRGLSDKLMAMLQLHQIPWDVKKALTVSLRIFSKADFKIQTQVEHVIVEYKPNVEFKRPPRRTM